MLDCEWIVPLIFILFCLSLAIPSSIRESKKDRRDIVKRRRIQIETEYLDLDSGTGYRKVQEHHKETGTPLGGQPIGKSNPTEKVHAMMGGR